MSRADFAVRPARDLRRAGLACAALAAFAFVFARSSSGLLFGLVLVGAAVACLRPRSATSGETFVMRGAVRTRRVPKSDISRFEVRGALLGRQYVELVTRQGHRFRVPGTDRPVPRHRAVAAGGRTPAEAVYNRLHLWLMVAAS